MVNRIDPNTQQLTGRLRSSARELGFEAFGVAEAGALQSYSAPVRRWLEQGHHGRMGYMENHFDKRIDPRLLLPGARSVVVVGQNYYLPTGQPEHCSYLIARYAYGRDYHRVMKNKLHQLASSLAEMAGEHPFRVFADSAPVLERAWAIEAGLGNTGKNSCLIIPGRGSFYFFGELITAVELAPTPRAVKDPCRSCTRCMEACPTQAILAPGVLDARKCISYLTIELKDATPPPYRGRCRGWVFGCDICQEVCPHNHRPEPHNEKALAPLSPISTWDNARWENCSREEFVKYFKKGDSPIARISHEKLMDNLRASGAGC